MPLSLDPGARSQKMLASEYKSSTVQYFRLQYYYSTIDCAKALYLATHQFIGRLCISPSASKIKDKMKVKRFQESTVRVSNHCSVRSCFTTIKAICFLQMLKYQA